MKKIVFALVFGFIPFIGFAQGMDGMNMGDGSMMNGDTMNGNMMHNTPSTEMMMSMDSPMMNNMYVTGMHPDISFIQNMIPHHQGAIDSAKVLQQYSKNAQMQKIAQNIITAQQKEISDFTALLSALNKENLSTAGIDIAKFDTDAKMDNNSMMVAMDSVTITNDVDRDFLTAMIEHHKGAVASSKQILKYSKDKRVIAIAKNIIRDQEKEIKEFSEILKTKK